MEGTWCGCQRRGSTLHRRAGSQHEDKQTASRQQPYAWLGDGPRAEAALVLSLAVRDYN